MATAKAWMNIALNNNTANPSDYADLVFLTSKTSEELDQLIFYSTSKFQKYMLTNVFNPVFDKFSKVCTLNTAQKVCTNKELTYQQWLDQSILPSTDAKNPLSYT